MKSDSELATLFSAFSHPWRIAILRVLLTHAVNGRHFGDLSKDLKISPSTLTHHLNEMENAGVLTRKTVGRTTTLRLDLSALTQATAQLVGLCCSAEPSPQAQKKAVSE